jgi:hypothetical protein
MEGGCTCGNIRYRMAARPLFGHCCHCRWCQRETGSAFVLNALIETENVKLLGGEAVVIDMPTLSGNGQKISRCPACKVALWSVYSGAGPDFRFVRVGTLDNPDDCPPQIHIFTESKQPWVVIPEGAPAVPQYYDRREYWPEEMLARREKVLARSRRGSMHRRANSSVDE